MADATLFRCHANPKRICRAKGVGACARCLADHHNSQLHRRYRAADAIGVNVKVLARAIADGALDDCSEGAGRRSPTTAGAAGSTASDCWQGSPAGSTDD